FIIIMPTPPSSTLFPYTTLFRSVNWYLGLKIEHYKNKKWFPVSKDKMLKAQATYQKYGYWSLLLSWVPIIGDPITLIAGLQKEKDRKSTRLNSSHVKISYAVFCL